MRAECAVRCPPGGKAHKHTRTMTFTHRCTTNGAQPQDVATCWASCCVHLCCITFPVCVFTISFVCVCVCVCVCRPYAPRVGLMDFPECQKPDSCKQYFSKGVPTCCHIAYTYLILSAREPEVTAGHDLLLSFNRKRLPTHRKTSKFKWGILSLAVGLWIITSRYKAGSLALCCCNPLPLCASVW